MPASRPSPSSFPRPRWRALLPRVCAGMGLLVLAAACGGGGSGGGTPPPGGPDAPSNLTYAAPTGLYRADEAIAANMPTAGGGAVDSYAIAPALPAGLAFDTTTGVISGTPTTPTAGATHTITATNAGGSTQAQVVVAVGAALPAAFADLREGFQAEVVVTNPQVTKAAKLVLAPDGRIFYLEVDAGQVRVLSPDGNGGFTLEATPYIDVSSFMLGGTPVTLHTGNHRGLFGLTVAPDFLTSGFVYLMLSVEEAMGANPRSVILRFTDDPVNNVATNMQVVLDGIPVAPTNNGGELLFEGNGPNLFVAIGDAENSANAQTAPATSMAGKILRILPTIPAQVPGTNMSGTPEWCRGIRNTYGMAQHPVTGGLFAGDNEGMEASTGFDMLDELNFIVEGKNYEWGAMPGSIPGADVGFRIWDSPMLTITPTALAWHTGTGFSTATSDSLLMATYNDHKIRQFVLSGVARADLDSVSDFATLEIAAQGNQPIDLEVDTSTGDIFLSLLSGLYRISAIQ